MKNFRTTIMPGKLPHGRNGALVPAHFGITFTDGKLSISGVIGAKSNGNCWGGAGQCIDALKDSGLVLAAGWTAETVARFVEVWERWHLNDMRPTCEHQRAEGWREKAGEKVTLYHWTINTDASKQKRAAERAATDALKAGETFTPTPEQVFFAGLEYGITTHTDTIPGELAAHYAPQKSLYPGGKGHTEIKTLGWLKPSEHPEGLLCRPCPVCGYQYGSAWLREEVPEDVLEWLYALPAAAVPCAWGRL
ncbi:MAG: hypothetical protein LBQ15_11135 [Clostridium sp.]|jgi:hypothetical protein|nr:hypothetical protein [Clostridium sp.]